MTAQDYLKDYVSRADTFLDTYFDKKIQEVKDIGKGTKAAVIAIDMLSRYRTFGHGGKKLRGALIQLGFQLGGGHKKAILEASTSIEVIHSFLLMHDDIEDEDAIRRGTLTIHKQYEIKEQDAHYGIAMGINMGDLGAYLGMELLLNSNLQANNKLQAATYLSRLLQRVTYGQGLDITYSHMPHIHEKDILQLHLHKTSIYTISGPLKIGALLIGLSAHKIKALEHFGDPLGIAFQLHDDELGLFSDEKTIGKSIGGDIKANKNTLLKIKALELASPQDKKFLLWAYGNKNITKKDIKRVQSITIRSGALTYSQNLSQQLLKKSKSYIPKITQDKKHRHLLSQIADLVITRAS